MTSNNIIRILLGSMVFLIAAYTIVSTSITYIDGTDWGLVDRLPTVFWIGLPLLGLLAYFSMKSKYSMVLVFVLAFLYLYILPVLVKEYQGISPNTYYPTAEGLLIASEGRFVSRANDPTHLVGSYHTWPWFLFFIAIVSVLTGITTSVLLRFFPLVIVSLFGLFTYAILRLKLGTTYSILGSVWFLSSFFYPEYYLGPPSMAFLMYLLFFLIVFKMFYDRRFQDEHGALMKLLIIVVFGTLVYTHALTTLVVLTAVITLYIAGKLFSTRRALVTSTTCILLVIIFLSYYIYVGYRFFNFSMASLYQSLLDIGQLAVYEESSRLAGSTQHTLTFACSWGIVIVNVIIAVAPILRMVLKRRISDEHNFPWIVWLAALVPFGLIIAYGGEAHQRAYMFGLIPLSYLCVRSLSNKPKILYGVLIGLLFLNIPASYGFDSYRIATETELTGTHFFASYSSSKTSCFYSFHTYVRYHDPLKSWHFLTLGSAPWTSMPNASEAVADADFILDSDIQDNYILYYLGSNPLLQLNLSDNYNRIYDNGRFRIYGNQLFPSAKNNATYNR